MQESTNGERGDQRDEAGSNENSTSTGEQQPSTTQAQQQPQPQPQPQPRSKPSGTHYVEPSPLGIEPVEQTDVAAQTNPPRSSERPAQTSEVPLGTGTHAEPPGGGGRESQQKS